MKNGEAEASPLSASGSARRLAAINSPSADAGRVGRLGRGDAKQGFKQQIDHGVLREGVIRVGDGGEADH